ncbi:MAG: hypothetical protein GX957_00710 [Clostridiaceae bacterium]|nr:hypothetical protein [Clostridiaceae bacterium]
MEALKNYDYEELQDVLFDIPAKEQKERFKVEDLQSADWCLRKIRAGEQKKKEMQEFANAEIERILMWLKNETAKIDDSQEFFKGLLSEYLYGQRKVDPKFKISTPNGTVSTRKQQPKWTYDDKRILESLKQSGRNEFIRIKEEVNKSELKKAVQVVDGQAVTKDGEIIEGITIADQGETVVVKVAE